MWTIVTVEDCTWVAYNLRDASPGYLRYATCFRVSLDRVVMEHGTGKFAVGFGEIHFQRV